jgi:hypothetical protein
MRFTQLNYPKNSYAVEMIKGLLKKSLSLDIIAPLLVM